MRRLFVLAVLLAGGCGPSSYDDFRVQLAKRACDRAVRCGQIGASERQLCAPPDAILAHTMEEPDFAVKNGRMRFFSDAAEDCLDAVNGAPCDDVALAYRVAQRCHHVLEPGAKQDQPCFAGECEGGQCRGATGGCPGQCASYPSPGDPCDRADPLACDPTVQYCDGVCQRKLPQGAQCDFDAQCVYGYVCVQDPAPSHCDDPPVFHAGDLCPVINRLCSDELYCSSENLCTPFVEAGNACDVDVACKPGLACAGLQRMRPGVAPATNGTCVAWGDSAQSCIAAPVSGCPASQECEGGSCQPVATGGKLNVGETCSADADCADSLYCQYSTCRYRVAVGGDCSSSDTACVAGLACDPSTHACVVPGAACP